MNHRIFERTLRSLVFRGACLFECHEILNPLCFCELQGGLDLGDCVGLVGRLPLNALAGLSVLLTVRGVIHYLRPGKSRLSGLVKLSNRLRTIHLLSDLKSGRTTR